MAAPPDSPRHQKRSDQSSLLPRLLDALGVEAPQQRELFERLLQVQARRRVPPEMAEDAISSAFDYHASLTEHALGIVHALHGGEAASPGAPTEYDETALSLGLMNVGAWVDRLTCAPLRLAARLVLTPDQQRMLSSIAERAAQPGAE